MKAKLPTRTITFEVSGRRPAGKSFAEAWNSGKLQSPRISFASVEIMFRILTEKRWRIIRTIMGKNSVSIREAARRVDRDVKAVHGDVQALLKAGVLWKTEGGKIEFPFDAIHIDVKITAA